MYSVSGRHDDDILRNVPDIFRKASKVHISSDLYRFITEIAKAHTDIAWSVLMSIKTHVTLIQAKVMKELLTEPLCITFYPV